MTCSWKNTSDLIVKLTSEMPAGNMATCVISPSRKSMLTEPQNPAQLTMRDEVWYSPKLHAGSVVVVVLDTVVDDVELVLDDSVAVVAELVKDVGVVELVAEVIEFVDDVAVLVEVAVVTEMLVDVVELAVAVVELVEVAVAVVNVLEEVVTVV